MLATDPIALAAVLRATGPIKVGGEVFTSDNAVRKLLNTTYLRFEDPAAQDTYFAAAARGIFDRLTSRPVDQVAVIKELASVASERRFLVWSRRPAERAQLTGAPVEGDLPRGRGAGAQVGMYLNDATASKMGYYLDYVGGLLPTSCTDAGVQSFDARLRLRLDAPRDPSGLPPYVTGNGLRAPKGSLRHVPEDLWTPRRPHHRGGGQRQAAARWRCSRTRGGRSPSSGCCSGPRAEIAITARMQTAEGQRGRPTLQWTPGVRGGATSVSAPSACD